MIRTSFELQIRNLARGGGRDPDRDIKAGYGSGINWRGTGTNPSGSVPICRNPDPDLAKNGRAFMKNATVKLK